MKKLKRLAGFLAFLFVFLLVINIIPPKENVKENPFLVEKGALPMIAAHRGGGGVTSRQRAAWRRAW